MACGMGGALGGLCMFPPFMSSTSGTIIMMSLLLLLLGSAAQSPSITHDAFGNLRSKISGGKQDEDGRGGGGKRDERHLEVNGLLVRTRTEREEKGLYSECRIHTYIITFFWSHNATDAPAPRPSASCNPLPSLPQRLPPRRQPDPTKASAPDPLPSPVAKARAFFGPRSPAPGPPPGPLGRAPRGRPRPTGLRSRVPRPGSGP